MTNKLNIIMKMISKYSSLIIKIEIICFLTMILVLCKKPQKELETSESFKPEKEALASMYKKINGTVLTESKVPIVGAIITYLNPVTKLPRGTITDYSGKFVLDSIPNYVHKITVVDVANNISKEVELDRTCFQIILE